jgi:ABC-type branched-subunit amino acid transport system ATPase component
VLELDGLTRRFGDLVALDDLTFSIVPGRMCGFVGPNGAGKTTAMRIVLGVLEPDAGAVRWNGVPVDAPTRSRFGYMPEERGLYQKMRVRDQLVYFAACTGSRTPTRARRRTAGSGGWVWTSGPATASRRSRWATSSASSSRSRSSTSPRCSCWTSRSPAWTRWAST